MCAQHHVQSAFNMNVSAFTRLHGVVVGSHLPGRRSTLEKSFGQFITRNNQWPIDFSLVKTAYYIPRSCSTALQFYSTNARSGIALRKLVTVITIITVEFVIFELSLR